MTLRQSALTAALLTALALAPGCGRGRRGDELSLWHIHTADPMATVVRDAVERFAGERPEWRVSNVPVSNDDFKLKLESAIGNPPDVFHSWGGETLADYARRGVVAELTGPQWREGITRAALDLCEVDGRLYAVPLDVSVVAMWYNTELFDRHNIAVPETFDELVTASERLRAAGVTPIALGARGQWTAAFYFMYSAVRRGGVALSQRAAALEPGAFASQEFIDAGHDAQRLVAAGAFPESFRIMDHTEAYAMFFEGEAAMILMGNWIVGNARGRDEALATSGEPGEPIVPKMGMFAYPGVGADEHRRIVVGGVNAGFAVSAQAPEAALDLLRALTDRQTAAGWLGRTGRIPARTDIDIEAAGAPAATRSAMTALEEATALQPYYDQYLPATLRELHKQTVFDTFAGRITPEEAAQKMESEAQRLRIGGWEAAPPRDGQ